MHKYMKKIIILSAFLVLFSACSFYEKENNKNTPAVDNQVKNVNAIEAIADKASEAIKDESIKRAQDAIRVSDLSNIKSELDIFFVNYGKYPSSLDLMVDNFYSLHELPTDPVAGEDYFYEAKISSETGKSCYILGTKFNDEDTMKNDDGIYDDLYEISNCKNKDTSTTDNQDKNSNIGETSLELATKSYTTKIDQDIDRTMDLISLADMIKAYSVDSEFPDSLQELVGSKYLNQRLNNFITNEDILYQVNNKKNCFVVGVKLNDEDKMKNDNGIYDDWYEQGYNIKECK